MLLYNSSIPLLYTFRMKNLILLLWERKCLRSSSLNHILSNRMFQNRIHHNTCTGFIYCYQPDINIAHDLWFMNLQLGKQLCLLSSIRRRIRDKPLLLCVCTCMHFLQTRVDSSHVYGVPLLLDREYNY